LHGCVLESAAMAILRRTLYWNAAGWALTGIVAAVAPRFAVETVSRQVGLADYAWIRIGGVGAFGFALFMVLVAHRIQDVWWWSWGFVIVAGLLTLIGVLNAALGPPDGSSAAFWWVFAAANGLFVASLLYGLGRTGMERPPI
jgi:hypothetical protein